MKLGAIHRPAPLVIKPLATRASLHLMTAPTSADWFAKCPADGDMLANDVLSNCVEIAEYRAAQIRRANAFGDTWSPTLNQVIGLYTDLTGYSPITGQPDIGTDTVQAMTAWTKTGIRINDQDLDVVHWATLFPSNNTHLAIGIACTGPVQVSLALPLAAQDTSLWAKPPGTGSAWNPASWGYHRVVVGKFDGLVRVCRTWGKDVEMHPDFWSKYVIGVDITLSREWLNATGLSPANLDWDQLSADVASL
jgi:hypothetical protein